MNKKHTIFHYIITIIITIIRDLLFIGFSGLLMYGGIYFFNKIESFFRIAVAIPLFIAGFTLLLMRLADLTEVILNPRINKSRCFLCDRVDK